MSLQSPDLKGQATSCKNAGFMIIVTLTLHIAKLGVLSVPEILLQDEKGKIKQN